MIIEISIFKLLIKSPFFGNIASKLSLKESLDIPKIRIDLGHRIELIYNQDWFETLTTNERLGILQHELMHIVLHHNTRRGDRKKALWAVACDLSVNQYIKEEYHLDDFITLAIVSDILNIDIPTMKSSEFYYDTLLYFESALLFSVNNKDVLLNNNNGFFKSEILLDLELSSLQSTILEKYIADSISYCGDNNEINGELKKEIYQKLSTSNLNWRSILKRFLSKQGKVVKRKSYKRISRRFENSQGNIKHKGIKALIALDESGSMSDKYTDIYLKELRDINRITGVDIDVVRFDSTCSSPMPLNKYVKDGSRLKRGSTDYSPIFELADSLKISQVIIFTDGEGIFPNIVKQRVLWILTDNKNSLPDFGEIVFFKGDD